MIFRRIFLAFPIVAATRTDVDWRRTGALGLVGWLLTRDITLQPTNWPLYYTEIAEGILARIAR